MPFVPTNYHTVGSSERLDGLRVAFQVLMPEDSGSNPEADSIYSSWRSLSWFGLASTPVESLPNLNPAFLLSTLCPLNRWTSVWFGNMLYGISMRLPRLERDSNDGNPSHPPTHTHTEIASRSGTKAWTGWLFPLDTLPLHFLPTFFARWRPGWVPSAAWNAI